MTEPPVSGVPLSSTDNASLTLTRGGNGTELSQYYYAYFDVSFPNSPPASGSDITVPVSPSQTNVYWSGINNIYYYLFQPSQTQATVLVAPSYDTTSESTENLRVSLTPTYNSATISPTNKQVDLQISNTNTNLPLIAIEALTTTQPSETGSVGGSYKVSRTGSTTSALTVNFGFQGTATSGQDYTTSGNSVVIPVGQSSAIVSFASVDDNVYEPGGETVTALLSGNAAYNVNPTAASATHTIQDNDSQPTISINSVTVLEGTGGTSSANLSITLSNPTNETVTVKYSTQDGTATTAAPSDYTAVSNQLATILPGANGTSISIPVTTDSILEPNETFYVNLATPTKATIAASKGTVTIDDDESETVTITKISGDLNFSEDDAANKTVTLRISRGMALPSKLMVNYGFASVVDQATTGVDFSAPGTSAEIKAGDTYVDVTLTAINDPDHEGYENVNMTLANGTGYTVGSPSNQIVSLIDEDGPPVFTITAKSQTVNEGSKAEFEVSMDRKSVFPVRINMHTGDVTAKAIDNDYQAIPYGTYMYFPAGGSLKQTVSVQTLQDTLYETNDYFNAYISNPVRADAPAQPGGSIGASYASVGIVDDDGPKIASVSNATIAEGGTLQFTLTLTMAVQQYTSLAYRTVNGTAIGGTNFMPVSIGVVALSSGNTVVINVPTQRDFVHTNNLSMSIEVFEPGTNFNSTPVTAAGTITNIDEPDLTLTNFRGNGTGWSVSYDVNSVPATSSFSISYYKSADGVTPGDQLGSTEISLAADKSVGSHSFTYEPQFNDEEVDYFLIAKIDSGAAIAETNESNNVRRFDGGIFQIEEEEEEEEKVVVHIHGTPLADDVQIGAGGIGTLNTRISRALPTVQSAQAGTLVDINGDGNVSEDDVALLEYNLDQIAADETPPWQNPLDPLDVDKNGFISAFDALNIINHLNVEGPHMLPADPQGTPAMYYDVTGDNYVNSYDAMTIMVQAFGSSNTVYWGNLLNPLDVNEDTFVNEADLTSIQSLWTSLGGFASVSTDTEFHVRTHEGNDVVDIAPEVDDIVWAFGGAGNDTITGGAANDILDGGDGDDLLLGGFGDDLLDGGNGDDSLVGGPDDDTYIGGSGENTYIDDASALPSFPPELVDYIIIVDDWYPEPEPYNSPPVAMQDDFTVEEDSSIEFTSNDLLSNDYDSDPSDTLSFVGFVGAPLHGTILNLGNGEWAYTPNTGHSESDEIRYRMTDGTTESTATIYFTTFRKDWDGGNLWTTTPELNSFTTYQIRVDAEEVPGIGIRRNTDVELAGQPDDDLLLSGVEFKDFLRIYQSAYTVILRRSSDAIQLWTNRQKTNAYFANGSNDFIFPQQTDYTKKYNFLTEWRSSNLEVDTADLQIVLKKSNGDESVSDKLVFHPFKSVVVGFVGEAQSPTDPKTGMHQIVDQARYDGFDAFLFDEDDISYDSVFGYIRDAADDLVNGNAPYDNHDPGQPPRNSIKTIKRHVDEMFVNEVSLIGYSHGGGAVKELSEQLLVGAGRPERAFLIPFTAYIDAVKKQSFVAEDIRPVESQVHMNLYQTGPIRGPLKVIQGRNLEEPGDFDFEDNVDSDADGGFQYKGSALGERMHTNRKGRGIAETVAIIEAVLRGTVDGIPYSGNVNLKDRVNKF